MRGRKPPDNYRAKLRALEGHPTPTHPLPQSVYGTGAPPPHFDSAPSLPLAGAKIQKVSRLPDVAHLPV
jgi:hypothetical protein